VAKSVERVVLHGPLEVELADGSVWTIRPGPYRKGLALAVVADAAGPQTRGRKPRPGTVKLRQRLERDHRHGRLQDARYYFQWLLVEDPTVNQGVARQVVYRELRRLEAQ
jgi:hypothetical protein